MDEFLILLQAKLDEARSKGNVNADIDKIQNQIDKLKIQAEIDPNTISNLVKQIEGIINQKITISNIEIDSNSAVKKAQQTGKQISNTINKEMSSASSAANKVLRDFSELNDAKRKFVDGHDLISREDISDAEQFYNTVRKAFSEFGQVTVSKGEMNDGVLDSMRVKIEQVNDEAKITRDFMLYLNSAGNFEDKFKLVDDDTIRSTEKMIQHLNEEKNIVNATGEEANAIKEKLAEQEKYYSRIKDDVNHLYSLKQKLLSADELQTAELEKQIKSTKQRITYNNQQIDKKDLRDNSLDREVNNLEVAKQRQLALANARTIDSANAKAQAQAQKEINSALKEQQVLQSQTDKIQLSIGDKGDTTTKIKTLSDSFIKLGLSADEVKEKMSGVDTELAELKTLLNGGANNSEITSQFEKLQRVLNETQNDLKATRSEYSLLVSAQRRLSKANDIEAWNQKNSKATKEVRASNEAYIASLRDLNSQMTKMQFNEIVNGFKESELSMRGLNKLGASLKDQFSQAAQSFTQWLSVSSGIMLFISKARNAVTELKEINNILTEISKTADQLSKTDLSNIEKSSFSTAGKYGKKASDYLTGIKEMYRAGYDNSEELAELSTLVQAAGDMEADLANDYIIATDAAYKLKGNTEALNAVLDGQNTINKMVALYRNI